MTKVLFGNIEVDKNQKEPLVQKVFTEVSENYDLMNDLMSFYLHRFWKDELIKAEIRPTSTDSLLDCAGGTGDLANLFLKCGGGQATVCDLNSSMLSEGKKKFPNNQMQWVHASAENLPFADDTFNYYTISFGIRNITNIALALEEAHRVLKPMGKIVCMEFSPTTSVDFLYKMYLDHVLPLMGKYVAKNEDAYIYLAESIKNFLPPALLLKKFKDTGFIEADYRKLSFGIVNIHYGYKS
jgi:demethylmenaquinone methyltransferase / 2-methoxy-6-polyprenyl-1,4-benzoquinol methylase